MSAELHFAIKPSSFLYEILCNRFYSCYMGSETDDRDRYIYPVKLFNIDLFLIM